ncbi:MAG: BBE domain-containing protein, partial [Candidatus Eisenbacteria bacterium]|nr:BBE domain-containing protein [Candidatus Eisenbacteria bacterium]
SADENPDLFWALRGGGGNFGIVTSIDYRLFPVGPEIFGGAIAWAADAAPEVLGLYRELVETAPPETTIVAALRPAPPAPWLDPAIHRKPMVALFVCHTGSMGSVEPLVARIRSIGRPVGDILQPRSYVSQQALLDATQPSGRRYYWKSEYLGGLADGFLSRSIAGTREFASPQSALLIFPLQGRLNELPGDDGAVGNRDAHFVVNIAGSWEMPADDARNIDWTRGLWENLREFSTGGTYVNFLTEDEPVSRLRSAYGSNYERLAESKRKWDPENVFRTNKNIAPGE